MYWQLNPYAVLLAVSTLVSGVVAVYAWRRRPAPGALPLALLLIGAAVWSFAYGVATGFQTLPVRIFWAKMQWLGYLLYLTHLNHFPHLDLTPFGYSLSGVVVAWGLFRYRLLDIVPVARAQLLDSMADGVIVLDAFDRVMDVNQVAEELIELPLQRIISHPAGQVFAAHPDLVERYADVFELSVEQGQHEQIVWEKGADQRHYDLQ